MEITYILEIYRAYLEGTRKIEPMWYLYCNDEKELESEIREEIFANIDTGDVFLDDYELNFSLPDEFVKEWKELKRLKDQE